MLNEVRGFPNLCNKFLCHKPNFCRYLETRS